MASVRIDTGPVEATDYLDRVPREQWHALMWKRRSFVRTRVPYDCRELVRFAEEAKVMHADLGFSSPEDFIRRGLEIDPRLVDWAVSGLRALAPDAAPVTLAEAVKAGRAARAQQLAVEVEPAKPAKPAPGEVRNPEGKNTGGKRADGTLSKRGSNHASYRVARLKRDEPEVAARLAAGEFKSVAEAWRAAGLEKPRDRVGELLRAFRRLGAEERDRFLAEAAKEA